MRPGRSATVGAALLILALSGCGAAGHDQSITFNPAGTAAPQEGSVSAVPEPSRTSPGTPAIDHQSADQIEGAVNDAQALLDGLDHDFASDS